MRTGNVLLILALFALSACGESPEPETNTEPAKESSMVWGHSNWNQANWE